MPFYRKNIEATNCGIRLKWTLTAIANVLRSNKNPSCLQFLRFFWLVFL